MIEEALTRGIPIRDRLDAQGVMWVIASSGRRVNYELSDDEWSEFDVFIDVPAAIRKEQIKGKVGSRAAEEADNRILSAVRQRR